jgi:hypothetical protein
MPERFGFNRLAAAREVQHIMIQTEQIPLLRGPRPEGATPTTRKAPRQRPPTARLSRRSLLGAAVASGTALGFSLLGVFPAARRADAEGYDIWTGACPSYAGNHNCSPGCGPSAVNINACEPAGGQHYGYHRTDAVGLVDYSLNPDACTTQWAEADGWMWSYSGYCAGCYVTDYRCHDGRTTVCSKQCVNYLTICRWRTRCIG